MLHRLLQTVVIGCVCFAALLVTPPALGQSDGPAFEPRFTSGDLERSIVVLKLTAEQAQSVRQLHEAYLADFAGACEKMRAYTEQYQEAVKNQPANNHTWDEWSKSFEKFQKHGDALGEQFLSDFKLALDPEQMARWPRVDQLAYRAKFVQRGWLSAESVDVVQIVEQMSLAPEVMARVDPILEEYERDLDAALHARQAYVDERMQEMQEAWQRQDTQRVGELYLQGRTLCLRVRDINLRCVRLLTAELGGESAESLQQTFNERAFSEAYSMCRGEILLAHARKLADLTAEQRAGLDQAGNALTPGLKAVRERWSASSLKYEAERTPVQLMAEEAEHTDRYAEQRSAIEALSTRAEAAIQATLTPEQWEQLPGNGGPKGLPKLEF